MFPVCKKFRRSPRLELKERTENRISNDGPLGYFDVLPLELKFIFFTYLRVEELSMMTILSKAMRNLIEVYKNTNLATQFDVIKTFIHKMVPLKQQSLFDTEFQRIGLLMKRSTCLYTTKDRLRLLNQFLHQYLCSLNKSCQDPIRCQALTCYGKFLHVVIAGWDDKECSRTYEFIGENTVMLKKLSNVVKSKPGSLSAAELETRLFLRRVFLDQCSSKSDKAFWLALILRDFPIVQRARLLFLLYGPMQGDSIQWYDMCESTPVNKDHANVCFGELAIAFKNLHFYCKEWSEGSIISVIDEITSFPEEWLTENTANLLYLCGDAITLKVLSSKAVNGRTSELASLITSLCLVCWRQAQPVTWAVDIVHSLCSIMEHPREKVSFLHAIIDTFREVILDLHDFADSDDDSSPDFHNMLDAQAEFSREVIFLAFHSLVKN